ncbi:11468_t:CDS:1, partial [Scutellospora calospora]
MNEVLQIIDISEISSNANNIEISETLQVNDMFEISFPSIRNIEISEVSHIEETFNNNKQNNIIESKH